MNFRIVALILSVLATCHASLLRNPQLDFEEVSISDVQEAPMPERELTYNEPVYEPEYTKSSKKWKKSNNKPRKKWGRKKYAAGDLGVRFNKVSDPDTGFSIQLEPKDYPIKGRVARLLKTRSIGDAPVTENDYELYGKAHAEDYIKRIGGPYSMPNSDSSHDFWPDFEDVLDTQLARRANANPNQIFRLPDLWQGMDIHEVAEAVHNEYPGSLQQELIEWLFKEGVEIDYDILPFRSKVDVVGKQFRFAHLNTWVFGAVAPINFLLKWHVGRPRPEEVAWKIATGELTTAHGVPNDVVNKIMSMNLGSPYEFTAYSEGSPTHPAWPAMHSAGSVASLWLAVACKDLTPQQYCEALRIDYATAFARTVAGVHYGTDNIAGLNLGQEIMKEKLADHFAEYYGSDRARVQAKLEQLSFDWADFDPEDCSIGK